MTDSLQVSASPYFWVIIPWKNSGFEYHRENLSHKGRSGLAKTNYSYEKRRKDLAKKKKKEEKRQMKQDRKQGEGTEPAEQESDIVTVDQLIGVFQEEESAATGEADSSEEE